MQSKLSRSCQSAVGQTALTLGVCGSSFDTTHAQRELVVMLHGIEVVHRLQLRAPVDAGEAHQRLEAQRRVVAQLQRHGQQRLARHAADGGGLDLLEREPRGGKGGLQAVENFSDGHRVLGLQAVCLAMDSRSIFSRSLKKLSISASGRGGQPGT